MTFKNFKYLFGDSKAKSLSVKSFGGKNFLVVNSDFSKAHEFGLKKGAKSVQRD